MDIIKFIRLAKNRMKGTQEEAIENYIRFQSFQAEEILKELRKRKISLSNMKVLELAVGTGGYSPVFKKASKELIINDMGEPHILNKYPNIKFKVFDVNKKWPFGDDSFDFIFCCSLIEHVENPKKMFSEIRRTLKKSGYLYLSFPPFYSPVGGHHFKPYHLLGEEISLKIFNFIKKQNVKSYAVSGDSGYGKYGIYKRTINGVRKLLKKEKFTVKDIWSRFSFINTAKIPLLRDFLTWHACFLCTNKKE